VKRWFPWITGAVIVGGLVWSFFYLKDLHPLGSLGTKLDRDHLAGVAIRFKNAKLVGRSEGKKVWTFEARTIDVSKDRRTATFRGVTRGSMLQNDEEIASLAADKVVYNTFTRDVEAPGSAELSLKNGPSFRIRKAFWNARQSKLICEGGVDVALDGSTMHGERMTADLVKKELVVEKVKGQIRLEE